MKNAFVFAILFFVSVAGYSQISFGAKGGLNLSNVNVSGEGVSVNYSSKPGILLGAFVNVPLSEGFSVQPEALFAGYGAKIEGETLGLSYISVPVMFKYGFSEKFYGEAGPQLGILLSAKAAGEDFSAEMKSTDFLLSVGGGVHLTEKVNIGVRYTYGLSNTAIESYGEKMTNRGLGIFAGITF